MVARAVFLAVAPIERRHRLAALPLAAQLVIGTDQSKLGQGGDGVAVFDAPPGPVPKHVSVEVSSDNRRTLREKIPVLLERAPQRAQLVLATDPRAGILRPNRQQIAGDGAGDTNGRDMAQGRVEWLAQLGRISIVGEDGEALIGIAAYPHRVRAETRKGAALREAARLGALADDGDIRPRAEQ